MRQQGIEENRRVIVIDDNESIHLDYRKILCGDGSSEALDKLEAAIFDTEDPANKMADIVYQIDSAYQGQEGLAKVEAAVEKGEPYALAFVDMRMPPGWDGLETIERLWNIDPDLQIVICTAYSDYSWQDIRDRLGQSDQLLLLKKPFDNAEVCLLAIAMTDKWRVTKQANIRLEELKTLVDTRTTELQVASDQLQVEIDERRLIEEKMSAILFAASS